MLINKHQIKLWFTFVEVIISISIMALFSVVWISSFEKFFKNSQMLNIKTKILSTITNEQNKIISLDISSYKITFATWSRVLFINENYYKNTQTIAFNNFDFYNLSGSLITSNTSTGEWIVTTRTNNIFNNSQYLNWSWMALNLDFSNINDFENIEVSSTIDKINTNRIIIDRIDYSWKESDNIQETLIDSLSWSELYKQISIENIMWNKKILVSTWTNPEHEYIWNIDLNITRGSQDLTFKLEK